MDMREMGGADAAPQEPTEGQPPTPSQPNADMIAAACVQATDVAARRLRSAMAAQGHTPSGV